MSTTIRSIDGRDLYVAENAADVRAALVEAASKRADLQRADLRGAYLQGAYLQRAYLQRADLRGAYLQGAYLQRAYLRGADLQGAYLQRAYLQRADLRGADLRGADLQGAYLQGADLQGAYLQGADLRGADLQRAYLQRADLQRAENFDPRRCNDLLILLEQPGAIRAYKLVDADYSSPMGFGVLTYAIGATLEVPDADTDATRDCGEGINLATLPWVMREWHEGRRILLVEFTAADIAAIPLGDGKFRVRRCTVIRELDLVDLGLVEKPVAVAAPAKPKRTRKAATACLG
jgi:uncharacterized protein YjbI with pentapeptide repeats